MKTSEQVADIYAAFAKAQGEFTVARKDSDNPFFKSTYADFQSVVEAARPALAKHGLSFSQAATYLDGIWILTTRVSHSSGQWFESTYPLNPVKNDPQGFASAQTYGKRHSLQALLGIVASDDDDAESSMGRGAQGSPSDQMASRADVVGILKKFEGIKVSRSQVLSYLGIAREDEVTTTMFDHLNEVGLAIKNKTADKDKVFGVSK